MQQGNLSEGSINSPLMPGILNQSHVWVPKFERMSLVVDILNTVKGEVSGATHIVVRDIQGEVTNRVRVEFEPGAIASLDLSLLMGGCQEDNRLVHGLVEVRSPISYVHAFRLLSGQDSLPMRESFILSRTAPFFYFLNSFDSNTSYFALINLGESEAEIQCRLYWERFYRESVKVVPPLGVRIVRVEDDFAEALSLEKDEAPRYIRIAQRNESSEVAVQVIEKSVDVNGTFHYSSY
jgi:hypothetical protein